MLRLKDCLERAVPLLLEATAQCGSLCHARAWRNTRVCCSGPRPGLVTVATTGLRLTLLPPLNLSVRGPMSRTRLITTATPSLPGVAPGRAGRALAGEALPSPAPALPQPREQGEHSHGTGVGAAGGQEHSTRPGQPVNAPAHVAVTPLSLWHQRQAWWVGGQCSATRSAFAQVCLVKCQLVPTT